MAHAACTTCRRVITWRARRGVRLADLRCACGGTLRASTVDGAAVARPETTGRRLRTCAVCGRRRYRLVAMLDPWRLRWPYNGTLASGRVGEFVCASHEPQAIQEEWYVATAQKHSDADARCGRAWQCMCGACRAARREGWTPKIQEEAP